MNKINHENYIAIEQSLIKVPFEQIKNCFRLTQKLLELDISKLKTNSTNVENLKSNKEELYSFLKELGTKIILFKEKILRIKDNEAKLFEKLQKRLNHLNKLSKIKTTTTTEYSKWCDSRANRLIVDYLSRNNYLKTSSMLAEKHAISDLVDFELYEQCSSIENSLKQMSCKPCLKWCNENVTTLKKMESTLEFELRIQELIELIRIGEHQKAIDYAKKNMQDHYNSREMQKTLTLMAFPSNTNCAPYNRLLDKKRWDKLVKKFRTEIYNLHSVTSMSIFELSLQAGLSALKTPYCIADETKNTNCPVCITETYAKLAESLPYSHHVNSSLVCTINGTVMDDSNTPLAMPNGYVYSTKAVHEEMSKNDGLFICPKTGKQYKLSDMRKVYVS